MEWRTFEFTRQRAAQKVRVAPCGCVSAVDIVNVIDYKRFGHGNGAVRIRSVLADNPGFGTILRKWNGEPVLTSCVLNLRPLYDSGLDVCNLEQWVHDVRNGEIDRLPGCKSAAVCVTEPWMPPTATDPKPIEDDTTVAARLVGAGTEIAGKTPALANAVRRNPAEVGAVVSAAKLLVRLPVGDPPFDRKHCPAGEIRPNPAVLKRAFRARHNLVCRILGLDPDVVEQLAVVSRFLELLHKVAERPAKVGYASAPTVIAVMQAAAALHAPELDV